MKNIFVAISSAGPNRDFSKGTREQPFWNEHAAFIDFTAEMAMRSRPGPPAAGAEAGCTGPVVVMFQPPKDPSGPAPEPASLAGPRRAASPC